VIAPSFIHSITGPFGSALSGVKGKKMSERGPAVARRKTVRITQAMVNSSPGTGRWRRSASGEEIKLPLGSVEVGIRI